MSHFLFFYYLAFIQNVTLKYIKQPNIILWCEQIYLKLKKKTEYYFTLIIKWNVTLITEKNSLVIYRMSTAPAPITATSNVAPAPPSVGVAGTAAQLKGGKAKYGGSKKIGGKGSCKGGSKKVGGKKSRKMPSAAKSWIKLVMEVFNKNRAKNPKYKYGQAMKDAAKLKKNNKSMKKGGEGEEMETPKPEEETM